jgi:hypothetical protein
MLLAVNFSKHLQGADSSNSTAFREIAAACEAGWPRRISASSALHLAHNRAETLESSRPEIDRSAPSSSAVCSGSLMRRGASPTKDAPTTCATGRIYPMRFLIPKVKTKTPAKRGAEAFTGVFSYAGMPYDIAEHNMRLSRAR